MPQQDTTQIKEKILNFLERKGPSLPVHIAKEIEVSGLFASAFLSELISNKKVKISHMKIGNSPLYYIPGQENKLVELSDNLKGREREAYDLLFKERFLKDDEQSPPIRVALRSIRDFAIPFKDNSGDIYWRFFTTPEEDFKKQNSNEENLDIFNKEDSKEEKENSQPKQIPEDNQQNTNDEKNNSKQENNQQNTNDEKNNSKQENKKKSKKTTKKVSRKSPAKSNKFFEEVKNFLNNKNIQIIGVEGVGKNNLALKISEKGQEKLIVCYNKKRVGEAEIIKAYKKSSEMGLPFDILSKGDPLKKIQDMLKASKSLENMQKLE